MEAVKFPEATADFGAPPGFTKEEVFTLPVNQGFYFIRGYNPVACITSCWELTDEDWMRWKPEGFDFDEWRFLKPKEPRIWLNIMGFGMPPVSLSTQYPFQENFDKTIGKYYHEHGKFPEEFQKEL